MLRRCVLFGKGTAVVGATYKDTNASAMMRLGSTVKRYSVGERHCHYSAATPKQLFTILKEHGDDRSIGSLCSLCRTLKTATHPALPRPFIDHLATEFERANPSILVASVVLALLDKRVRPGEVVPCASVFDCLKALDQLGDEDRLTVERKVHELLLYNKDPGASVLCYCVRPDEHRHVAAPEIRVFLEKLLSDVTIKSVPPSTDTTPTPDDADLIDYMRALNSDIEMVHIVVSLIRSVPRRYRKHFNVLFAMRLETLLRACADVVWPDDTVPEKDEEMNDLLNRLRSSLRVDSPQAVELPSYSSDPITWEALCNNEEWHRGFTKTIKVPGFLIELTPTQSTNGDTDDTYSVINARKFMVSCGEQGATPVSDFATLIDVLRGGIVPQLQPFDPATVLLREHKYIHYSPVVDGIIPQEVNPAFEPQLYKRHCHLVSGGSGTGKTVFSTITLPQIMYRDKAFVLHYTIKREQQNDDKVFMEIERLDREHRGELKTDKRAQLRHMFACCALRRRREGAAYPDEESYGMWVKFCNDILGSNPRNMYVKEWTISVLKEMMKGRASAENDIKWVYESIHVSKYPKPVILVFDELGKCLSLARALISAQYDIYQDPWVRQHLTKLELVLCGTGTEMVFNASSSQYIATDPTSVSVTTLLKPNPLLLEAVFSNALGVSEGLPNKYPMLTSQYDSSPLFNDAKTNTRLFFLACTVLKNYIQLVHTTQESDIEKKKRASRLDKCFAHTLGLDGCVRLAIPWYIQCNGLGRARTEEDQRAIDATLTSALRDVRPLIPLPPLHHDPSLMEKASTLGLIVLQSGEMPSAALTAVVTFGYSEPCAALEGYTQERFTAEWASRLVDVQTGCAAPIVPLPFCVPWRDKNSPTRDDVTSLLQRLREQKALVLLNGPSAPGADVMIVQLRRPFSELSHRMSLETYSKIYPRNVAAILTVVSNKQSNSNEMQQGVTLGVVNINHLFETLPIAIGKEVLEVMLKAEIDSEEKASNKVETLRGEIRGIIHKKELNTLSQKTGAYRGSTSNHVKGLKRLVVIATALERHSGDTNNGNGSSNSSNNADAQKKQLDMLHGLEDNDYHYAGPLFLGLLCVRALMEEGIKNNGDNNDDANSKNETYQQYDEALLSNDPHTLRTALNTALKDERLKSIMRTMDGDTSDVKVLVRPRFVCGKDPSAARDNEPWRSSVLCGEAFNWAAAEDTKDWVCAPGSFGPLESKIRVK